MLRLTIDDNTSTEPRTNTITISPKITNGDLKPLECVITQAGATIPTLSKLNVTNRNKYEFTVSATYSSEFPVTECGICYSTSTNTPTLFDNVIPQTANDTEGTISVKATNLVSGATYYVRAYIKTALGTTLSETLPITTVGSKPNEGDNDSPIL